MPHLDHYEKYVPATSYAHMGPRDAHIWNEFIIHNPHHFRYAIYDVRCGPTTPCPPNTDKHIADAWDDLCRGRIDVVAFNDDGIYVIEVKPRARGEAIGQAINNAHLYELDQHPDLPVFPVVITDVIIPGTRIVAAAKHVKLWTPTENDPPQSARPRVNYKR